MSPSMRHAHLILSCKLVACTLLLALGGGPDAAASSHSVPNGFWILPSSLEFGSLATQRSLLIGNHDGSEPAVEVWASVPWITVTTNAGTSGQPDSRVHVQLDRAGLSPGVHCAQLAIRGEQSAIAVPVRVTVEGTHVQGDAPVLSVDVDELDLGSRATRAAFHVTNVGNASMRYTVSSTTPWITVSPTSGNNRGTDDTIDVNVRRDNIASGTYCGTVSIATEDDQTHDVMIWMTVPNAGPPPQLILSDQFLNFGTKTFRRGFWLRNAGAGSLNYTITSSADWMVVEPAQGVLSDTPQPVTVSVDRNPIFTGVYEADLTVLTGEGTSATVTVHLEKHVTSPLIIPWLEANIATPEEIEHAAQGLHIWRRVTDTAVVTTTIGREYLYPALTAQAPDMTIIPGVKTVGRLGYTDFDSLEKWQLLAGDVAAMAEAANQTCVVLENETALHAYWDGWAEIDLDQLRVCLACLPPDIDIIWHPSIHSSLPELQQRSADLCQVVEEVLGNVQFVDLSFCHPEWRFDPWWIANRNTLESIADSPTLPIIYYGQFGNVHYWDYDQVHDAMRALTGRPGGLFYPGGPRWVEAAETIVPAFDTFPPDPQDPSFGGGKMNSRQHVPRRAAGQLNIDAPRLVSPRSARRTD